MRYARLLIAAFVPGLVLGCGHTASHTAVADPRHNVRGDVTRAYLDVVSAEVVKAGGAYELTVETAEPLPAPGILAEGQRIDCIWFIDIDRNRATGQSANGNDYNIHLQLDHDGFRPLLFKVSDVAQNDGATVAQEDIGIRFQGTRATLIVPAQALPADTFDWWLYMSTLNATDGAPRTENPPTTRATFAS